MVIVCLAYTLTTNCSIRHDCWMRDIVFPYRIDNYCKIVCGMKHQGRYSDDMHIIHRSKEVLLEVLEGIKKIAAEYGLILNEKKTHICKLSSDYRYLQVKYTLLQNGVVVRRIHPKAITRERRKLKAYKRLLDKGIVTIEEIDGYFRSWLSGNYKYMSRDQIYKMNSLYVKLFGRSVTWKVTLADGTSLGSLKLNGNNFISTTEVTKEMFEDNLTEVTIEGGDTIEKHENMELVQISKMGEEWWFILRDIPAEELEQMALKAQLDYLSMMVDPEL